MNKKLNNKIRYLIEKRIFDYETYGGSDDDFRFHEVMSRSNIYTPSKWFEYWLSEGIGECWIEFNEIVKKIFKEEKEAKELDVEFSLNDRIKTEITKLRMDVGHEKQSMKISEDYQNSHKDYKESYRDAGSKFISMYIIDFKTRNADKFEEILKKAKELIEEEK